MKHFLSILFLGVSLSGLCPAADQKAAIANATNSPAATTNRQPGNSGKLQPPNGAGRPFSGIIATYDRTTRMIVLQGKSKQTFYLTPQTKIDKAGAATAESSIAAGQYITGYARHWNDHLEATTLHIGGKHAADPPTGK